MCSGVYVQRDHDNCFVRGRESHACMHVAGERQLSETRAPTVRYRDPRKGVVSLDGTVRTLELVVTASWP